MRVEIGITILHPCGQWYTSRMRKKKQSFELTFEQTEKLAKFSDASFDYPKLSFEKVARKLLGPKPFKAQRRGSSLKEYAERCLTEKGNERRSGRTL